jgi:hypothetical protein
VNGRHRWAQTQREHWALVKKADDLALFAMRDEGLTFEQIGVRLGCSRQAAAVRLAKARVRDGIREALRG